MRAMLRNISYRRPGRRRVHRRPFFSEAGMTLLELIIACAILLILSSAALPIAKYTIIRQKEAELHRDLREIKDAIDRYKDAGDRKIRFLRKIPVDPMTGQAEWGLRAVQDDPDSTSWGGKNVFDVYSKSTGTALDGTKYSDW